MGVRLHVTNGESAASALQRTALGAVLFWEDALHEGPVPVRPRAALLRTRAGFLSECGWGTRSAILSIDRWVGGTHVTPGNLWRWDADGLRLVR